MKSKLTVAANKIVIFIEMFFGVICVLGGFSYMAIYVSDDKFAAEVGQSFLVMSSIMVIIGVLLIVLSRKRRNLLREFRRYVAAISNEPRGYIPNIAASLGTSEDVVCKNIQRMIKKKLFSNALIDRHSNRIIILGRAEHTVSQAAHNFHEPPKIQKEPAVNVNAAELEMVTVKCRGCGGLNTLAKGRSGECEYCGSVIKGE